MCQCQVIIIKPWEVARTDLSLSLSVHHGYWLYKQVATVNYLLHYKYSNQILFHEPEVLVLKLTSLHQHHRPPRVGVADVTL